MPLFPTKYSTDGKVNQRIIEFYRARAEGGVGLIVLDCPCLDYPRAYKGSHVLRFDTDEFEPGLKELISAVQEGGAKAFMHLNYPAEWEVKPQTTGAKKKGDKWVVDLVNILSLKEVDEITGFMVEGTKKAEKLGFDGIEIDGKRPHGNPF